MKIAIGSDHRGLALKTALAAYLIHAGHAVTDRGTMTEESCDYPLFARRVARSVDTGASSRGILICNSGIGMEMAANKLRGVRAANCTNMAMVKYSREHNDANVLVLGAQFIKPALAKRMVAVWLKTEFAAGRHQRRVKMFSY